MTELERRYVYAAARADGIAALAETLPGLTESQRVCLAHMHRDALEMRSRAWGEWIDSMRSEEAA